MYKNQADSDVHLRTIVAFVNETLSGVTQYYPTVGNNIWDSLYSKHQLLESNITLDRVYAMLAEFLIELKLNEEQDKITQIVTGSNGAAKHSMYDEYINASEGKVPSKGKAMEEMVKLESRIGLHLVMNSGSQTSLSEVSSKETARKVCDLHLNVHVQSSPKPRMPSGMTTPGSKKKSNGRNIHGNQKSMKLPSARKEKARGLGRRASPRERERRDRLHQDRLSPNLLEMPEPNPKPNLKPLLRDK